MKTKHAGATIHDVARTAGVSVTTVSRVLNNRADVAPETAERIRKAVSDLNYTASLAARGLRSRTTNVIGLVVSDVTEAFNLEIIRGVGTALRHSDYDLMVYTGSTPGLEKPPAWEQEHVALLQNGLTDGCIVITPVAPDFVDPSRIVVVDPNGKGGKVPSVIATNRRGALDMMRYLIGLGHRRIGFITGRYDTQSANDRFQGYQEALAEAGITFAPSLVERGDYSREQGHAAARALLTRADRPSAIFAANDQTALGVMDAAAELGLQIPQDLSIAGFDNIPEAALTTPRLTTIDQSIQQMGMQAATMLINILQGVAPELNPLDIPTQLVIRDSCQPPRR